MIHTTARRQGMTAAFRVTMRMQSRWLKGYRAVMLTAAGLALLASLSAGRLISAKRKPGSGSVQT